MYTQLIGCTFQTCSPTVYPPFCHQQAPTQAPYCPPAQGAQPHTTDATVLIYNCNSVPPYCPPGVTQSPPMCVTMNCAQPRTLDATVLIYNCNSVPPYCPPGVTQSPPMCVTMDCAQPRTLDASIGIYNCTTKLPNCPPGYTQSPPACVTQGCAQPHTTDATVLIYNCNSVPPYCPPGITQSPPMCVTMNCAQPHTIDATVGIHNCVTRNPVCPTGATLPAELCGTQGCAQPHTTDATVGIWYCTTQGINTCYTPALTQGCQPPPVSIICTQAVCHPQQGAQAHTTDATVGVYNCNTRDYRCITMPAQCPPPPGVPAQAYAQAQPQGQVSRVPMSLYVECVPTMPPGNCWCAPNTVADCVPPTQTICVTGAACHQQHAGAQAQVQAQRQIPTLYQCPGPNTIPYTAPCVITVQTCESIGPHKCPTHPQTCII